MLLGMGKLGSMRDQVEFPWLQLSVVSDIVSIEHLEILKRRRVIVVYLYMPLSLIWLGKCGALCSEIWFACSRSIGRIVW